MVRELAGAIEVLKQKSPLIPLLTSIVVLIGTTLVFVFSTFATKAEVEKDHKDVTGHITEIREDIRDVNKKLDVLLLRHK